MMHHPAVRAVARFGLARHRPAGDWTVATPPELVVGTQDRRAELSAFTAAVRRADRHGLRYGLRLHRPAPGANTIVVVGGAASGRSPGRESWREWPVGELSGALSTQVIAQFMDHDIPIAAELVSIVDPPEAAPLLSVAVLIPAIHGASCAIGPRRAGR